MVYEAKIAGQRINMADRQAENWRPPLHNPAITSTQQFIAGLRRFFDLQAGSAWPDLKAELAEIQGRMLDVGVGHSHIAVCWHRAQLTSDSTRFMPRRTSAMKCPIPSTMMGIHGPSLTKLSITYSVRKHSNTSCTPKVCWRKRIAVCAPTVV